MLLTVLFAVFAHPIAYPVLTVPTAEAAYTAPDYSTTTLKAYAEQVAKQNGLDSVAFVRTIECESSWDRFAQGDYPDGKGHFVPKYKAPEGSQPTSFGLCQLHYPSRDWGIATSSAYDPYVCIPIMAAAWKNGQENKWACY